MKKKQFSLCIVVISLFILCVSWANQLCQWELFHIPVASFSALAVFFSSLLLWLFVATDWPSLLCILSLGFIPSMTMSKAGQLSFGNSTFIFLMMTFVVTYALNQTYFLKRVVAVLLNNQWAQSHPRRFIMAFLTAVLLLSSIISPTVIFMFLLPLYEEICAQFGIKKGDKASSYLLIALFVTIAIGTAMTPINHVFAITAMSLYESVTKQSIGTVQYMQFAVPTGLALYSILLITISYLFKVSIPKQAVQKIDSLTKIPHVTKREKWIVGAFVAMIVMWLVPEFLAGILPGVAVFFKSAGLTFPPIVITIILALIKIDDEPLVNIPIALSKGVHWPSLLLVGATLALGSVLSNEKIGVISLLNGHITPMILQLSPFFVLVFFIVWAGIQTNFTSNLVTVSVVTTLALTVFQSTQMQINIAVLCCLIGFMSSLAFVTAPAMPYVAISIGTGWTNSKDVFLFGVWMLLWSVITAICIGYPLGLLVM